VIWADVPDPAVIRVGETYYMSSTTMHMSSGLPIMKSRDLVNWEMLNYAYDRLVENDAMNLENGQSTYGRGSWASCLRYHDGTYYATTFSATSGQTHIYRTQDIEKGKWKANFFSPSLHDHTLFFDDDGRVYMIYGGGKLMLVELLPDLSGIKPDGINQVIIENTNLLFGEDEVGGLNGEGSQLIRVNGKYYLLNIASPRSRWSRSVLIHRADRITGPWEGRVALEDKGVAQGCLIDTPDGKWYAMLFQDNGAVGRSPWLVPVKWEDGWPVLGIDGKAPVTLDIEDKTEGLANIVASDEFNRKPGDPLPLAWQWNHNPDNRLWSIGERKGYLRLTTGRIDTTVLLARNTLTQRTFGPVSSAVAKVDVANMRDGDCAGLIAMQRRYGFVGVRMEGGKKSVVMVSVPPDPPGQHRQHRSSEEVECIPLPRSTVYLKIDCDFRNRTDKAFFYYSLDGKAWNKIGSVLQMAYTLPHFMGYRFGLFNYATKSPGGYVDFDYYHISNKISQDKMAWWRDARFGMFIHWGIYSVPAGVYQGKEIPGIGEWIMNNAKIPVAKYEKYAAHFNPVDFNADEWIKLAEEAGMKYIVITSKHHDGFAMFHSRVSPYNIVDATPFKRDVIGEIAAACKKHKMPLGLYYSQAQDWHAPGGSAAGGHWDQAQDGDMDQYLDQIAVPQVHEILENYGGIKILWFDTPYGMTPERAAKFLSIVQQHPDLIYNDRLGGDVEGDLKTPEQYIPATGIPGKNWESCMTMNDTWGFKIHDRNWKSTRTLVRNLIDIASKGGNYLLNVGPTSMGSIPEASIKRLKEMGAWMYINGEAIYGTSASPFKKLAWGRCTRKAVDGKVLLYLHVFDFPDNGMLTLPGLAGKIYKAYPLANKNKLLNVIPDANNPKVDLSSVFRDSNATVIVIEVEKDFKVYNAPDIQADYDIFMDTVRFKISTDIDRAVIHYTTDGTVPTESSPVSGKINKVSLPNSFTVKASCFLDGKAVSGMAEKQFSKETPSPGIKIENTEPGLHFKYYEGKWNSLPDFNSLKAAEEGICVQPDIAVKKQAFNYGLVFTGYLLAPETNVYQFRLTSDDGSLLRINEKTLLNDGLHAMETKILNMALEKGLHAIDIQFFQAGGEDGLTIDWKIGDQSAARIPAENWVY
ncbi:alpha-L-fucosidase, partial [bacterium]|nr:alpha-L-fucosidase [bacterium]